MLQLLSEALGAGQLAAVYVLLTLVFFSFFLQLLSEALGGDQLAAVYVLLTLVSKTVSRPHKSMVVGKFSLGLIHVCTHILRDN